MDYERLKSFCSTSHQEEVINEVMRTGSQRKAAHSLGVNKTTVERLIKRVKALSEKQGYAPEYATEDVITIEPDSDVVNKNLKKAKDGARKKKSKYAITWAQNATPVHHGFWKSLINYCSHNNAVLLVIPGRYKNPTSQWTEAQEENEYWCPEVAPFLMNKRINLLDDLQIMGDIKTIPTAASPLTGFNTITGGASGIFGHPKVQLKTVATPQNKLPKILTTTGACTVENYTDSKAGKKGEFHHILGAAVVEISGDEFHLRQISATNDGSFIDLGMEYTPAGIKPAESGARYGRHPHRCNGRRLRKVYIHNQEQHS